jgi:putative colanic acid biosynthesis acetyltransferase WcaF
MKLGSSDYIDSLTMTNKIFRLTFRIFWSLVGLLFPGRVLNGAKRGVINLFGGDCDRGAVIYSSSKVFDPRNLSMRCNSTVGPNTIIYNVDKISIGEGTIISQYAHLNTASHDFRKDEFPLIYAPIEIGSNCWVASEAYLGMGVKLCNEVIIGARSSVFKSIEKPGVYVGSPAKIINS